MYLNNVKEKLVDFLTKTGLSKLGYQKFSDGTSFHGFHELYYAKSIFWKLFWFATCTTACVLTAYQVWNATSAYIDSSTVTLILPAQESEILYPAFSLCFWHWYYWVNWTKASSFNVSKEALLYGFSYYSFVYAPQFYVEKARDEFLTMMEKRNFTTFSKFYFSVARDAPIFGDNGVKNYFDKKHIFFNVDFNMLCYQISPPSMKRFFDSLQTSNNWLQPKVLSFNVYDETYDNYKSLVTPEEHRLYMIRWMTRFTMYSLNNDSKAAHMQFSEFVPPKVLVLINNVVKGTQIQPENDGYLIDVRASAYTWQNKQDRPCVDNTSAISTDKTCQNACESYYQLETCSCQTLEMAFRTGNDKLDNICQRGITFYNVTDQTETLTLGYSQMQNCTNDTDILQSYYTCLNSCTPACQIWSYDKTITIKSTSNILRSVGTKGSSTIRIEYPMGKDIVIMTEMDAQSWENFIGNVGGLLGIWTGASMVSFLEIFYLCCCADHGDWDIVSKCVGMKNKVKIKKIKINPPTNTAAI